MSDGLYLVRELSRIFGARSLGELARIFAMAPSSRLARLERRVARLELAVSARSMRAPEGAFAIQDELFSLRGGRA